MLIRQSKILSAAKALLAGHFRQWEKVVMSVVMMALILPGLCPIDAAAQAFRINKKKTEETLKEETKAKEEPQKESEAAQEETLETEAPKRKLKKGKKISSRKEETKKEENTNEEQEAQEPTEEGHLEVLFPVDVREPIEVTPIDEKVTAGGDTILNVVANPAAEYDLQGHRIFNPNPTRAVWLSALFPGLGQVYNRRYWKLPIIIGGFLGLGYGTSWNNTQYQDYSKAYRDLLDNDPDTKSYMDFFPPTTLESDLDKNWLASTMKSRKDFYRRNRDLCIICVAALYLICMVDAYVDASLAHFDISPNLSLDVQPALFIEPVGKKPALGLNWAFNF